MKRTLVRGALLPLLVLLVAILGGCWGRSFFRMPNETLSASAKIDSLLEENAALRDRIARIERTLAEDQEFARGTNAQLKMDLEELKDQLGALQEMLREAQDSSPFKPTERRKVTRPDTTGTRSPAPTGGGNGAVSSGGPAADTLDLARSVPPDTLPGGADSDTAGAVAAPAPPPEEMFRQIYIDYNKRAYQVALEESEAFLAEYADDPLGEEVLFIRGQCLMELANQTDALKEFSTLLQRYPRGKRAPGALLRMAISYEQLGQTELAAGVARRLMNEFPRSEEASVAEERFGAILGE